MAELLSGRSVIHAHPLRSYNFFVRQEVNTLLLVAEPQTRRLG